MTTLNFPVQQGFFFTTSVTEHFPTTASTISRLFPDRRHFPTRRTRGVRRTRPNGSSKSPATAHATPTSPHVIVTEGSALQTSQTRPDLSGAVQHGDTRVTTQRSHTKTGTQGRYTRGQTRVTTQRTPANLTHRPGSRAAQHTSNNTTITSTHPHSAIIPKSAEEEEVEEEEEEEWTPI